MKQETVASKVYKTDKELNEIVNSFDFNEFPTLGAILKHLDINPEGFFFLGKKKVPGSDTFTTIGLTVESSMRDISNLVITSHKIGG